MTYMAVIFSIPLTKQEKLRFAHAALQFGFTPDKFIRYLVAETTREVLAIPEESLDEYVNAGEIQTALRDAIRAERSRKLRRSLPASLFSSRRCCAGIKHDA
jgi:hypothetical protein